MTVHWLENDLRRKSAVLACQHILGRHTYDVIAETMEKILHEYGIHNKTEGAVTDSGSNFLKAFRLFAAEETFEDSCSVTTVTDSKYAEEE